MARSTQTDSAVVDTRPEVARVCPLATSATASRSHPGDVSSLRLVAIVFLHLPARETGYIARGSRTSASYTVEEVTMSMTDTPTLGMLQLAHTPVRLPGAISNPATYDFPVHYRQVPGAWTSNVIGPDDLIHEAYIAAARTMEKDGVAAITSNCGFTARFQKDVAASV